jgi:hypothetical protein
VALLAATVLVYESYVLAATDAAHDGHFSHHATAPACPERR